MTDQQKEQGEDPIRALIAEMRTIVLAAGQASVEGPRDFLARQAAAEAERAARWADQLDALLAAAPVLSADPQHRKVADHLIALAGRVTKSRPGQFCFQVLRRDRDDGTIEYQIFADTKGNGTQVAYVQSTRHDAEFIAACLAQAPLFDALLAASAPRIGRGEEQKDDLARTGELGEGPTPQHASTDEKGL